MFVSYLGIVLEVRHIRILSSRAHLDKVFPPETDVHVTREGNLLKGPGIRDDCRGLAALLALIKAMNDSNLNPRGTLTFVADVGEGGRRCLWHEGTLRRYVEGPDRRFHID